jgi:lipoate-protein ligase A
MRPTGGLAVLHGHDLTVALALPMRGPTKSYREATRPILSAFADQGVACRLAENQADPQSRGFEDCFALRGRSDIIDEGGRKLCGCALRRTRNAVLLQASIPVREPEFEPGEIIRGGVRTAFTRLDESRFAESVERALEAVYLTIHR